MPYFPLLFILKGEFLCGNNFPYKVKLKYQKERKLNMAAFLNFTKEKEKEENRVVQIPISEIVPNPHQPRTEFDYNDISSLAESICQNGILQPLSVRKVDRGYELIAGERRLRAAKLVQLRYVPCIILDISARTSAVLALVENIQRQDLSFFDEANAIEKLISYYGMTQEDAALKLGKAQSTIANKLRILKLSDEEKELITKFNLTERHARALLRLGSKEERLEIINRVIKFNLNVERTEQAIDEYIGKAKDKESYRKRSKVFQNVKIFVNTINKAVETMKAAGIPADSKKIQNEDYIEYRVKIPIMNGNKNF
jgi:ParB family chromosome partitioning protein